MKIKYLDPKSAEKIMTENLTSQELLKVSVLDDNYKKLRNQLRAIRFKILGSKAADINYNFDYNKYEFDLRFGLEMRRLFESEYSTVFTERVLSNNSFWIYLSVSVIPDIVSERWGENNHARSYKVPRRIWLNTLWWYIHLSWQGDYKQTYEVLKNNSTDHIMQLVERAGRGYDIELYRKIMYYYSFLSPKDKVINDRATFRSVLILNTARIQVVEPKLVLDSYDGYVLSLFKTLGLEFKNNRFERGN